MKRSTAGSRLNIVFVTTRQWNPGDEIILFGCLQLMNQCGFEFNPVIFNRNPQIRHKGKTRNVHRLKLGNWQFNPFLDNSVKDDTDLGFVDLVVFAGSPEWRGQRLTALYRQLAALDTPVLFLGLGTNRPFAFNEEHFSADEMAVFRKARLITCRDSLTTASLQPLPVRQLSCPALLSSGHEQVRTEVRRIGLIFGSHLAVRNNNVSEPTYQYLHALYTTLLQRYGQRWAFELIAHYIDELPHAARDFKGMTAPGCGVPHPPPEGARNCLRSGRATVAPVPLRYSYDARDYIEIYGRYDLVIGHRVHGIGVSASQGVPGICISHDTRGETARGFGAQMIGVGTPIDEVCALVETMAGSLESRSREILDHKRRVAADYRSAVLAALADDPGAD
jgi:Polysaccharide pyruvyl transferase